MSTLEKYFCLHPCGWNVTKVVDQCTGIFANERLTGISMALIIDTGQMTALIKIYLWTSQHSQ